MKTGTKNGRGKITIPIKIGKLTVKQLKPRAVVQFDHGEKFPPVSLLEDVEGTLYLGSRPLDGLEELQPVSLKSAEAWFAACKHLGEPTFIDQSRADLILAGASSLKTVEMLIPVLPEVERMAQVSGLSYETVSVAVLTLGVIRMMERKAP